MTTSTLKHFDRDTQLDYLFVFKNIEKLNLEELSSNQTDSSMKVLGELIDELILVKQINTIALLNQYRLAKTFSNETGIKLTALNIIEDIKLAIGQIKDIFDDGKVDLFISLLNSVDDKSRAILNKRKYK